MAFKPKKRDEKKYEDIESVFYDLPARKIETLFSHQADILRSYQRDAFSNQNIAIELPTGSGKSLVGLLIGEYRRNNLKERVVYLCPTRQLVHQVVDQANNKYGIKALGFVGKKDEYSPADKSAFKNSEAIAITTYSSLFNINPFFKEANLIIADDSHSAENYISSNWSLQVDRHEFESIYLNIIELLKGKIDEQIYIQITDDTPDPFKKNWIEKLAFPHLLAIKNELFQLLEIELSNTKLVYSWLKVKNHLHACNIFFSWDEILIRPIIPPSKENKAFANANQRIFMSATLGNGGDLERITGVKSMYRIPIPKGWDKQGLGRRFFIFPQQSLDGEEINNSLIKFFDYTPRAVVIVSSDFKIKQWEDELAEKIPELKTFKAKDIEESKTEFLNTKKAIVLLANRYDGIDFLGDESRLLILSEIPYSANIQEKFIQSRMNASVIFYDRNRTRLIQAIGRCTRSPKDFAAVVILGEGLFDWFSYDDKMRYFHPELQGELKFGIEQSKELGQDDLIENFQIFMNQTRDSHWQEEAEPQILQYRDESVQDNIPGEKELKFVVGKEVDFTYSLWNKQYEEAISIGSEILQGLSGGSELKGYRAFWSYMIGNAAWLSYNESGKEHFKNKAKEYYDKAIRISPSISWLRGITDEDNPAGVDIEKNFSHNIDNLEGILLELKIHKAPKFISELRQIQNNLSIHDNFEKAHEQIGRLLGFDTGNSDAPGAPDPYWISNGDFVIVFEDKLYEAPNNPIRLADISQSLRHEGWIRENLKQIKHEAEVFTVILSNRSTVDPSSKHACNNLFYWNYDEFVSWSKELISFITDLRNKYTGRGDNSWKEAVISEFTIKKYRPRDIIERLERLEKYVTET